MVFARRCLTVFAVITIIAPAAAQTYKWTDERGVVTYGNKPPPGRPAQLVDTQPLGPADLPPEQQKRLDAEARRRADVPPPPPAPAAPPPAAVQAPRGMGFDTYIRLDRGMSEGELLLRAGRPDEVALDTNAYGLVKSYYYFPTGADPFITVVMLRGGRIANLERTRKF
jgi:hypothetical protein